MFVCGHVKINKIEFCRYIKKLFYCFGRMSHFQINFFKEVAILGEWYKARKTVLTVLAWAIAYLKWKKNSAWIRPDRGVIQYFLKFWKMFEFLRLTKMEYDKSLRNFSLRTKKYERSITVKSLLKIHCNITGTGKLLWSNTKTLLSPSVSKGD